MAPKPDPVASLKRLRSRRRSSGLWSRVDDTTGPISFLPGQYVHLSVPGSHEHRSYSFANPPTETNRLEFYVKVLDQGAMSAYVTGRAQPGDNMAITGPFGRFYLRPPARPLLMVAGGTGLAPMLSMLAVIGAAGSNQPVHLLYGANRPQELFALEQLEGYADRGVNLTTELAVVEGGPGWDGPTGHITDRLRPDVIYRGDCDVYLCGPPPMIDAGRSWLLANGTETARIHTETFLAS